VNFVFARAVFGSETPKKSRDTRKVFANEPQLAVPL
jgi:hypothetical protein